MVKFVTNWFKQNFVEQERAIFWLFLLFIVFAFALFGRMLVPVIASVVIAYLLQWFVVRLEHWRVPRILAVIIVYLLFLAVVVLALLGLLPLLWKQLSNVVNQLPTTLGRGQALLWNLPERYPHFVSPDQIQQLLDHIKLELAQIGQTIISASLASIPGLMLIIVYLVLVPLLVYFFLMDRKLILRWFGRYLPKNKNLLQRVWKEAYAQIGNYVRGKVLEMIIVWLACYIVFGFMGLQYALLLSVFVGLSVVVPYIGAVAVTIPVVVLAFLQWGWSTSFGYLLLAYAIIITLDANILVPLLFSETVALHPVAIIIAILIFGGLWGFWGVFFAIPLAAVVKAIINALSRSSQDRIAHENT
jgi:putative permease